MADLALSRLNKNGTEGAPRWTRNGQLRIAHAGGTYLRKISTIAFPFELNYLSVRRWKTCLSFSLFLSRSLHRLLRLVSKSSTASAMAKRWQEEKRSHGGSCFVRPMINEFSARHDEDSLKNLQIDSAVSG